MSENENVVINDEVVSYKEWLITLLIMMIPVVNIVMMFVWAFGDETKKSKSNYFKAALTMAAIGIVLSIAFMFLMVFIGILGAAAFAM